MSEKEYLSVQATGLIEFSEKLVEAAKDGWQVETEDVAHAPRQQGITFFTVLYKEEVAVKEQPTEKTKPVPPVRKPKQQNAEE